MTDSNILWGSIVAEELYLAGVRLVCISPGSRSTPLVWGLVKLREMRSDLELIVHLDERNASFFGLGFAKRYSTPVALVCTSGTAPAHYFPAIIEANLSLVPLIILSADRPPSFRDCGAPQTIDQIKLYGDQVRYFGDVGLPHSNQAGINGLVNTLRRAIAIAKGNLGTPRGAVHLNFSFDEPLIDQPNLAYPFLHKKRLEIASPTTISSELVSEVLTRIVEKICQCPRGIIIVGVGDFPAPMAQMLQALSDRIGYPVLVEAIGLQRANFISHYDSFLRSQQFCTTYIPQFVIRFGGMPTSKYLSQWLAQHLQEWEEIVFGQTFSNPLHGNSHGICCDPICFLSQLLERVSSRHELFNPLWNEAFQQAEAKSVRVTNEFLNQVPFWFEGIVYQELAKSLPDHSCLYVANSMATRDLDIFFHSDKQIKVLANKGANGIDGTISSALGSAFVASYPTVLICGDIAFYHDLNALLTAREYQINLTIFLLNNDGGAIFNYLPIAAYDPPFQEFFRTPHELNFGEIVRAFGVDYQLVSSYQELQQEIRLIPERKMTKVLEIKIDPQLSYGLHHQLWQRIIEVI